MPLPFEARVNSRWFHRVLFVRRRTTPYEGRIGPETGSLVHISTTMVFEGATLTDQLPLAALCGKTRYEAEQCLVVRDWATWDKPNKRICVDCVMAML